MEREPDWLSSHQERLPVTACVLSHSGISTRIAGVLLRIILSNSSSLIWDATGYLDR